MFGKRKERDEREAALLQRLEELTGQMNTFEELAKRMNASENLTEQMNAAENFAERMNASENLAERMGAIENGLAQIEAQASAGQETLLTQISRHNANIDNLIDSIEERAKDRSAARKQAAKGRDKEEKFLSLLDQYQELFFFMRQLLIQSADGAQWTKQFEVMDSALAEKHALCGLSLIEQSGVPVELSLHEVIEARAVADASKDGKVIEVIQPGCVYMGKVRKKARVIAGKWNGENGGEK
ncbi:MAG: nucleotide exchange factor GrpE [Lachnospiraceae bacterium]|nr:nucleotide exchange factor GrpE [Lachnospiraceae bacterium]